MNTRFSKVTGIMLIALWLACLHIHGAAGAGKEVGGLIDGTVSYTVQPGDTLSGIAKTFSIDVNSIIKANHLKTTVIHPYQVLVIPSGVVESTGIMSRGNVSREDLLLLARAIYAEARGESFEDQVAVGAVVLNRLNSPHFPDTIQEVIWQRNRHVYQFTPVSNGTINLTPDSKAIQAAVKALEGHDPTGGALFFYNPQISTDNWIKTLPVLTTIGRHVFATKS